jgi:hypothetical protein
VNVYAEGEDRKVATFKALAETWKLPEAKQWHKYLGDFWGPIILYMRHHKNILGKTLVQIGISGQISHGRTPPHDLSRILHHGDCAKSGRIGEEMV